MKRLTILISLLLFAGFSSATVTSVDSVTYNSNNEFFDGDVYAISVTADRATDKIDISLDESELSEAADGEVNQDLSIEFTHQNNELQYSTSTSGELRRVVTLVPYTKQDIDTKEDAISSIKSDCYDLNLDGNGSGRYEAYYDYGDVSYNYRIYCFQSNEYLGVPAYIDNPDEIFTADVELTADGKSVQTPVFNH